jgi:hypothetical protein
MIRHGGVLLAVALLAGTAQAEVKWVTSPRAEKVNQAAAKRAAAAPSVMKQELWKGSKAIIFDQETKQLRKPTMAEVAQMVRHLRQMTSKPVQAIAGRVQSNGVRQGSLEGEQANVVVARAKEDGQYETLCVQTFEEAADYLGLVRVGGDK